MNTKQIDNPFWQEVQPILNASNFEERLHQFQQRDKFCHQYAWAIPDPVALAFVVEHAGTHVIEMGAGRGYWAYLLAQYGIDVLAYDNTPPDQVSNHFFSNVDIGQLVSLYHRIHTGDASVLTEHADRTLFLCWPPYADDMALQCVRAYPGNKIIYIGESAGGCNGTDEFFDLLEQEWEEVAGHRIAQWDGIHDWIQVFKRI